MANTFKFGNGKWAVKEGSALAYNDENGNFKPLPFDFTRSTSATRVNKDGLIEVVTNNKPRIDFLNDSNGALLLEPARTNSLLQSNQFDTTWLKSSGVTITSEQAISPDGNNNGWKFEKTAASFKSIGQGYTSSSETTFSVFAKKGTLNIITLFANISGATNLYQIFDLENGIVSTGAGMSNSNIENYGNGWFKCSSTFTNASVTSLDFFPEFSENNAGYIYIYGAQAEQGSYATSYIPTQGSAVTRVAESCEQNLSNQVSLTEGVFYVDVTNLGRTQNANILTQNSTSNSVYGYIQTNNRIVFGLFANSVSVPITSSLEYEIGTRTKIAFNYKSGNSKLYVNGSLVGNSTDTFTIGSGFADAIRLIDNASAYFAFPEKSILQEFKIYNTALTDAELIELTTI